MTFPKSLTALGFNPSEDCPALNEIQVAEGNPRFESIDGVFFQKGGKVLLTYPPRRQGHYKVPETVEKIGCGAFQNCTDLTSIELPEELKEIGDNIFRNCTGLKSVRLPRATVRIPMGLFWNCSSLQAVELPAGVHSRAVRA